MDHIDALVTADRNGIAIIADAAGASVDALVARGLDQDRAEHLVDAAGVFYGRVRNRKAQAACVAAARDNQHRLETLVYIARSSKSLDSDATRWHYREVLCATKGDLRTITNRAKALKRTLKPTKPRAPKASITFHEKGWSTLHITGRTSEVLPLYQAAKDDPAGWVAGDVAASVGKAVITTVLNMDIGDYVQWRAHPELAHEIEVQLTNGEWVTGTELINRKLRAAGYIALISPTAGPINLYATTLLDNDDTAGADTATASAGAQTATSTAGAGSTGTAGAKGTAGGGAAGTGRSTGSTGSAGTGGRGGVQACASTPITMPASDAAAESAPRATGGGPRRATRELRLLMSADSVTCAWKGCEHPADFSEAHHIREWAKGGATTIGNLCWLCRYHNRQNGRPKRGRMQRMNGQIIWESPKGYATARGRNHNDPTVRARRLANIPVTDPPDATPPDTGPSQAQPPGPGASGPSTSEAAPPGS